ncbi:MAG: hypothetical protein C0601_01370 [Candidatus Muiribacterium halophilum]|uniref:Nudix hydrolase domain-containing protein n=1 Tax=Muiribacterium halophilum TaxID=2053465 RepID=A0A2N5ZLQ3_MUIH1|nr:MAG: hypothetical protein C0601_01370 [Candidatus Muirbacterium halophilum]
MEYRNPALTVDGIIETSEGIVLIKRKNDPFKGCWAIPGGFVDYGERVEDALVREMKEELSVDVVINKMLGVYSEPDRDPRGHTVSVVYIASLIDEKQKIKAADYAAEYISTFKPLEERLAFDHKRILEDYFFFKTNS